MTDENPDSTDFGEFRVDAALRVDDALFKYDADATNPSNCDAFSTLTGVVHYSFGNHKLLPRDATDFGSPTAVGSTGASATVTVSGNSFTPEFTCVDRGATVLWTNSDTAAHTATERDPVADTAASPAAFDVSLPVVGASNAHTFADAGTYHYLCTIHTSMTGRVIVLE